MNRQQLEHIIRAAAANANVREIVIVGSQAILGAFPNAPSSLTESMEADVFPKGDPQLSVVIDGAIGEESLFHSTFGYYAHGVDETTAILPDGWQDRLVKIDTPETMGAVGWCLDPHDLAVSKLAARREKDFQFVEQMLRTQMTNLEMIRDRLRKTSRLNSADRQMLESSLERWR